MTGPAAPARFGHTTLPQEQHDMLQRAKRIQYGGLAYMTTVIVLVYLVMGSSQAMKAAWAEDLLSLIPPIAFLVAVHRARRPPSVRHPYGHHRSVGAGHLAAAVALLSMGLFLVYDSGSGLLKGEHPPIGTVHLFGQTVWSGWLMIAVLVYAGVGPVILGRLKLPLAQGLHDKVLYADADMNKADWMTAGSAILGILGIGMGLWWADGAAAMVISLSILRDGIRQLKGATEDLLDGEARTFDDGDTHPVIDEVLHAARDEGWVGEVACRVRDEGHVFHTEVFVVPVGVPEVERLESLAESIKALDWKLDDVVVAPVSVLPEGVRSTPRGLETP
ncbi:cation transporter [Nostocoides sp. F2B08]|uniref:cation diffusion facilitator family transporter n=1 Tax=Nostocoides sp. F2B08 TaxID=2653936 RepID=UPI0012639578|nr:cation transporter [Tetrasphaera sp. F2B08]KAB7745308.1 cation transporter [Tetrasphaera sp. F2B08]